MKLAAGSYHEPTIPWRSHTSAPAAVETRQAAGDFNFTARESTEDHSVFRSVNFGLLELRHPQKA
jgi:hypothetical protein